MSYTFEQLKEDVRKEAEALKIHATKEERERLDMEALIPPFADACVYGLMTGSCFSYRAAELIHSCAVRYFENKGFADIEDEGFSGVVKRVNGRTVENFIAERTMESLDIDAHYSAIEAYILLPEAKNANLIAFLRGETETLEL